MTRRRSRKLTLREAAAEAWSRRLIPFAWGSAAASPGLAEAFDDLRQRTAWRPPQESSRSHHRAFITALERVRVPAFRINQNLAERAQALWGAAERLERERAQCDLRNFDEITPETCFAVSDAYLVAADAFGEAGNHRMAVQMERNAESFRSLARDLLYLASRPTREG